MANKFSYYSQCKVRWPPQRMYWECYWQENKRLHIISGSYETLIIITLLFTQSNFLQYLSYHTYKANVVQHSEMFAVIQNSGIIWPAGWITYIVTANFKSGLKYAHICVGPCLCCDLDFTLSVYRTAGRATATAPHCGGWAMHCGIAVVQLNNQIIYPIHMLSCKPVSEFQILTLMVWLTAKYLNAQVTNHKKYQLNPR